MNTATIFFSILGLAGVGVAGTAVRTMYEIRKKLIVNRAKRVLSSIFGVFVFLFGITLAGLALSFVLTKHWSMFSHFVLLACICTAGFYVQLIPTRNKVKAAAKAAAEQTTVAKFEPTVDPVTPVAAAPAPGSNEQAAPVSSVVPVSAVAAATAAAVRASHDDESSIPPGPVPTVVSAVSDDDLDAWTPEEDDFEPVAAIAPVEPVAVSEVVESAPVVVSAPSPVIAVVNDEPADVLDLSDVTKVQVTEVASQAEASVPSVATTSDISVAAA